MNIQTEYIKSLLKKYYAGESTLAEEDQLREYFASADTDPELAPDRAVFAATGADIKAPRSLREAVERNIAHTRRSTRRKPRRGRIWAAAAVFAAAVATSVAFLTQKPADNQITPEEAREQTLMALTLLTSTMRKGCDAIELSAKTTDAGLRTAEEKLNGI